MITIKKAFTPVEILAIIGIVGFIAILLVSAFVDKFQQRAVTQVVTTQGALFY